MSTGNKQPTTADSPKCPTQLENCKGSAHWLQRWVRRIVSPCYGPAEFVTRTLDHAGIAIPVSKHDVTPAMLAKNPNLKRINPPNNDAKLTHGGKTKGTTDEK